MDEARYSKVLYQCCLERDLELWDAGDETEVGEKVTWENNDLLRRLHNDRD
jgi:hypothetical protein